MEPSGGYATVSSDGGGSLSHVECGNNIITVCGVKPHAVHSFTYLSFQQNDKDLGGEAIGGKMTPCFAFHFSYFAV